MPLKVTISLRVLPTTIMNTNVWARRNFEVELTLAALTGLGVFCGSRLAKIMRFWNKIFTEYCVRSRDRVAGIATTYGLDDRGVGVRSPGRVKNFLFSKSFRSALRSTQPPIQLVPGDLSPGVKRPGREVDHSPPTSAEVKNTLIYISTPRWISMA
jgi:hypothetical protein